MGKEIRKGDVVIRREEEEKEEGRGGVKKVCDYQAKP